MTPTTSRQASIMDTSQLPKTSEGSKNDNSGQAISSHQVQQQYLTIVQDPYPPLCSSPELFDTNNNNYDQLNGFIDCIDIDDSNR